MKNYYALIMAGGGGTRLWPLSRRDRPKQMLPLVGEDSLFRISITRLAPIFPPERIFVVTGAAQVEALRADVPELPPMNFIVEPFGRDSGPAAGLGMAHIASLDPSAVVAILTADHYIGDVEGFCNALKAAYQVAVQGYIVTLGIKPTAPVTGFGYIQQGDPLTEARGLNVFHSAGFKEKPDAATAQKFVESGLYTWNSGMFIWSVTRAMEEFQRQQPKLHQNLSAIQAAFGSDQYQATIETIWADMPKISLDYAIMEHAEKVAMIPVEIGWSDIGSWAAVYEEQANNLADNVMMGSGEHVAIDTLGTLIHSKRMVVTIGMDNWVIVDTDDVLLICPRDRAQEVKRVVEQLKAQGLERYL